MQSGSQFEENAVCDACGRFGAFDFGDERLCVDCYEGRGSCCSEFAGNDLCTTPEPAPEKEEPEARQRAER